MSQLRTQSPLWQRLPQDLWRLLMYRYIVPAVRPAVLRVCVRACG